MHIKTHSDTGKLSGTHGILWMQTVAHLFLKYSRTRCALLLLLLLRALLLPTLLLLPSSPSPLLLLYLSQTNEDSSHHTVKEFRAVSVNLGVLGGGVVHPNLVKRPEMESEEKGEGAECDANKRRGSMKKMLDGSIEEVTEEEEEEGEWAKVRVTLNAGMRVLMSFVRDAHMRTPTCRHTHIFHICHD